MKKLVITLMICAMALSGHAQLQRLGNKVKNKVNQRIDRKIDKTIDEGLDAAEGKEQPTENTNPSGAESDGGSATETPTRASVSSFSKFDFVPGEKVIFYDNFESSRIGEFPDYWLTNGMGQTVTLDQYPGQWLKLSKNSRYAPDKRFNLPSDYTIEFDLIMLAPENHTLGGLEIKLVHLTDDGNPMAAWRFDHSSANLHLGWNSSSMRIQDSQSKLHNNFTNNVLYNYRGTPVHVAIAVNGTRYRLWINEQKVFDIPQLLLKEAKRNQIFLETNLSKDDPEYQAFISNFRVAEGKPDLRKALHEAGKFVTHGITFDSGSDQLKPESYGILREIALVLEEDKSLKVRIIGHTDSDGSAELNLDLSRKRANAIRIALMETYKIEGNRLETDGKGAAEPIDSNTTAEGKANNRRAEFIKI